MFPASLPITQIGRQILVPTPLPVGQCSLYDGGIGGCSNGKSGTFGSRYRAFHPPGTLCSHPPGFIKKIADFTSWPQKLSVCCTSGCEWTIAAEILCLELEDAGTGNQFSKDRHECHLSRHPNGCARTLCRAYGGNNSSRHLFSVPPGRVDNAVQAIPSLQTKYPGSGMIEIIRKNHLANHAASAHGIHRGRTLMFRVTLTCKDRVETSLSGINAVRFRGRLFLEFEDSLWVQASAKKIGETQGIA